MEETESIRTAIKLAKMCLVVMPIINLTTKRFCVATIHWLGAFRPVA